MTQVYFATNRAFFFFFDSSYTVSYTDQIQPPTLVSGLVFGCAEVDGVDITSNSAGTITTIGQVSTGGFLPALAQSLAASPRNLVVFLHGFDNSFTDALTRAAFNREWIAACGLQQADTDMVAFSWPSLGKLFGFPIPQEDYKRDQGMARASGVHTMTFLAALEPILIAARNAGRHTYLLAHSMGNLALQSAVENWFLHGKSDVQLFDRVFLLAADCAYDTFGQPPPLAMSNLARLSAAVSVHFSRCDHVLQLSFLVNLGAQRLGQKGPENMADITQFPPERWHMYDATEIGDYNVNFLTSHQYYRLSPTVRQAICGMMLPALLPAEAAV